MSFIIANIRSKCPYCGIENRVEAAFGGSNFTHNQVFKCDHEEGGCDKNYMVTVTATFKAKSYTVEAKGR